MDAWVIGSFAQLGVFEWIEILSVYFWPIDHNNHFEFSSLELKIQIYKCISDLYLKYSKLNSISFTLQIVLLLASHFG